MTRFPSAIGRSLPLLASILLAGLLTGCSSGPDVLARIDKRTITREDFLEFARNAGSQYTGSADSAKAALLGDLVKAQMMVLAAEKLGLVDEQQRARSLHEMEHQLALRALIDRLAPASVPVSDAEVRALYEKRGQEAHVRIVFTPDSETIRRAFDEVRAGSDFGAVADRFNMAGMTPPHGDLGYRVAGSLIPALDHAMTDAPIGQVVGPVESPGSGWFLVKVMDRRPRAREPFDQVSGSLRTMLEQGKRRALLEKAQRDLMAQYHVKFAPDAVEILFRRYNSPKDTIRVGKSAMPVPAPPTPEESQRPLAQYDGPNGKPIAYALGDAVKDLQNEANPHPNFNMAPMIDQWVRAMVLQRVLAVETDRRHIAEEPAIARQARRQADNTLLQAGYNALVAEHITVTESDVRADFERHASQLKRVQNARLRVAQISDSAAAMRAAQKSQEGAGFDDIVRAAGPAARVSETNVTYPTDDPTWKLLESSFLRMQPGQSEGPFAPAPGRWIVVQLVDRTVVPMTYETVDPGTRQGLQGEVQEMKREARLNQVTDSLRSVYHPVIHSGRLKSIPWPVPAAPQTPGS